jgi:hypothetical protein
LYSVSFAAIIPFKDFESDPNPLQHIDIMIKRPSDNKEVPISDVLLGKKMSAEEIKEIQDRQEAASENEEAFSDKAKGYISDILADAIKKAL